MKSSSSYIVKEISVTVAQIKKLTNVYTWHTIIYNGIETKSMSMKKSWFSLPQPKFHILHLPLEEAFWSGNFLYILPNFIKSLSFRMFALLRVLCFIYLPSHNIWPEEEKSHMPLSGHPVNDVKHVFFSHILLNWNIYFFVKKYVSYHHIWWTSTHPSALSSWPSSASSSFIILAMNILNLILIGLSDNLQQYNRDNLCLIFIMGKMKRFISGNVKRY